MKAGWQTSTLGDVLAVIRNGVNCKQDKSGKGDRISRIESISSATFDLDKVGYAKLSERDKGKNLLQRGDILFSHINSAVHVGKTAVFDCDEQVYHGVNLLLMRPKENVTSAYLNHALKYLYQKGYWRGVCKQSVNQASVNQQDISRGEIRFPRSLTEQQHIVSKLDNAFVGLAQAKENAEKNLQNARALFESHLESIFSQRGNGWVEKRLEEIGKTQTGSTPSTSDQSNYGDFISFVKPGDFNTDGTLDYSKHGLSKRGADGARIVPAGSVLMVCIGATIGKCGYCDQDVTTNQQVNALTPCDGSSNRFIYYQMLTETFQHKVIHASGQATLPIINKSKWSALSVWLTPQATEQKIIAAKLDAILAETQRLARIYEQKLEALESLKKSILHEAFSGNL